MTKVYKIVSRAEWSEAEQVGVFKGAEIDLRDGYIHLSTAVQAPETARLHFAGRDDLLLVRLDATRLGAALKWEPSRGDALFPHLYGPLDCALAEAVSPIRLAADGAPELGDLPP